MAPCLLVTKSSPPSVRSASRSLSSTSGHFVSATCQIITIWMPESKKFPWPLVRYVIASLVLVMSLNVSKGRFNDLTWCSSGAALWVRIVATVPHGRVYLALAQLAQQAHTRDTQGDDVPFVCPPSIFPSSIGCLEFSAC